jgi:hypothetical protein
MFNVPASHFEPGTLNKAQPMSLYEVQKLLFHVNREPKILDRFQHERETLIAEYRFTEEERRALLDVDFRSLYEMGVHSLLLGPLAATLGVSFPDYLAILRGS